MYLVQVCEIPTVNPVTFHQIYRDNSWQFSPVAVDYSGSQTITQRDNQKS